MPWGPAYQGQTVVSLHLWRRFILCSALLSAVLQQLGSNGPGCCMLEWHGSHRSNARASAAPTLLLGHYSSLMSAASCYSRCHVKISF